jgi:hypothetical protein
MGLGLWNFIRTPPRPDPASVIGDQLANRESAFLSTARKAVFGNPGSPYAHMFRLAGCEYGDLDAKVRRDGLEKALESLNREGVYLTHSEFKGLKPLVRGGVEIPASTASFANRTSAPSLEQVSSGSRSSATHSRMPATLVSYREAFQCLIRDEFRLAGLESVGLLPILPSLGGLLRCAVSARIGSPVSRWFSVGGTVCDTLSYRALTAALVAEARLAGAYVPFPSYLRPNDFVKVAEWIAARRSQGAASYLTSIVSPAVRVAAAAIEHGLDISGSLFLVGGEALTEAKRTLIESGGVKVFPHYGISEIGQAGHACSHMTSGNCVHVMLDTVAVLQQRQLAPLSGVEVSSLLFTTLLPFAPYFLINVEMEDAGVLGPAQCGCSLSARGFNLQIDDLYSYGKLTGHGMTMVGTDMLRILEQTLPAEFGGAPGDYQLEEREGRAQTEFALRVSPRVRVQSVEQVRASFLAQVRGLYGGALTARHWSHSNGIQVIIAEPFLTGGGKVLPLHLLGKPKPESRP